MGTNITGIGNANAIGFKSRVTGGMYFPPELKDALVGVWSAYGKSNDSTDRNVIKNKIKDRGGDFELLNFDYKEGSGYGKYNITLQDFPYRENVVSVSDNKAVFSAGGQLLLPYPSMNKDMPSFRIKVSGLSGTYHFRYYYRSSNGVQDSINMAKDGYYDLPICYNVQSSSDGTNCGFANNGSDVVTIEQIPQFQGAVVTDGVDDLIVSQKSIKEMLEGSNEITVISMIHQISLNAKYNVGLTNYIRSTTGTGSSFLRNDVKSAEKTGIYGYTASNLNSNTGKNASVINKILGDKNDYTSFTTDNYILDDSLFHVQNFTHLDGTMSNEGSQVAWYWTFIAKRVLTEDEINLVIEKYNLDRPGEIVKPDVYYDIKRQKITNENHSSFDDELTDFSGNGHNMKLYNFAWEKQSGIGSYPISFKDYTYVSSRATVQVNKDSFIITSNSNTGNFLEVNTKNKTLPIYKVKVEGTNTITNGVLSYRFNNTESVISTMRIPEDGEYEIPESPSTVNNTYSGWCINGGTNDGIRVKITIIPEHESALVLDGIDDYGKVTGLPILKDYTIAADYIRTFAKENAQDSPILSKSKVVGSGAFLFNYLNVDSVTSSYSFGTNNGLREINDSERRIYYLSKYVSDGYNINAGSAVDYDSMWLGTYRDNISNFFTGALHFAMLFPYSLSEFLLERQINKVKAGTLYPDMIEWRPVVTKDDNMTNVKYYTVNDNVWTPLNPGDMVPVGQHVVITVDTILPHKVDTARSSDLIINRIVQSAGGYSGWDIHAYTKKNKTPQKIKITTAVNESIVQWKPTITSNLLDSFTASSWYLNGWDNTITVGTWIKKTDRVFFKATFKTGLYGLETATFGGAECVVSKADNWSDSKNIWDIRMLGTVGDLNQVFNLDVYELIRYEDIDFSTAYPFIPLLQDISWGDKLKVGGEVTYIGFKNILPNLYTRTGEMKLNGAPIVSNTPITIEKVMKFEISRNYALDDNEPKVILSPDRLQIPNSSYKILGHIPDISGHSNHGVIHNSAYSGVSGADGEISWKFSVDEILIANNLILSDDWHKIYIINDEIDMYAYPGQGTIRNGKVRVSGMKDNSYMSFQGDAMNSFNITKDGIYDFPYVDIDQQAHTLMYAINCKGVTIEGIGEYEGAYCLDGVDDFINIPTLSSGGKQVLMKVNWLKSPALLYDQRASGGFAILTTNEDDATNPRIAYQARNQNGKTYVDGIENNYIETYSLKGITHNITVTNPSAGSGVVPVIGANTGKSNSFAEMSLYDFMLFDEISTDEEIKQLNDIVGIEGGYVQKPPYYWDAYGKTNSDDDRSTIQQRGVVKGYNFAPFDNELDWYLIPNNPYIDVVSRNGYSITLKNLSTGIDGWRFQNSRIIGFITNDIPFKIRTNKFIRVYWNLHSYKISDGTAFGHVIKNPAVNPNEDTFINLRHLTEEELTELDADKSRMYYLLWFDLSALAVDEEVIVEMLPVEGGKSLALTNNNFAYDKMSGYGGYSFKSFNDSQDTWNIRGDGTGVEIISRDGYSMTVKKLVQNLDWQIFNNEYRYPTVLNKELPFKCKSNKKVGLVWQLKYKTEGATSDTTVTLINQQLTPNVPLEISLPYKTQDELTELGAVSTSVYYLLYFSNTTLEIGEEYTVEMLPLYPNGLVYDGVDDNSENVNIPAFIDYTYIFKRDILGFNNRSVSMHKGTSTNHGRAFTSDYDYGATGEVLAYSFGSQLPTPNATSKKIIYGTQTSVDGQDIRPGLNVDDSGLFIGKWYEEFFKKMVFYKLFLYPRTIDMLSINMVKNMMEEGGIIDITSKLFTDKYTGDYDFKDFNNDFFIGD